MFELFLGLGIGLAIGYAVATVTLTPEIDSLHYRICAEKTCAGTSHWDIARKGCSCESSFEPVK